MRAFDLIFTQEGVDLRIEGDDKVNTLLLNVDKDDFLENYPDNLQIVPAVEVDVFWANPTQTTNTNTASSNEGAFW